MTNPNIIPSAGSLDFTAWLRNNGYIYSNHSDGDKDANGNAYWAITATRYDGKVDVIILRQTRVAHTLELIHVFDEVRYGKNGYASLVVIDPHILVNLSSRQADGSTLTAQWLLKDGINF